MKLAVTFENNEIFQHFGHCENFKIFEIENNNIVSSKIINSNGEGHEALAGFLAKQGVTVLICGGIGQGAVAALNSFKIEIYGGNSGNIENVVSLYLKGNLKKNSNANCDHHDHEHHSCHSAFHLKRPK